VCCGAAVDLWRAAVRQRYAGAPARPRALVHRPVRAGAPPTRQSMCYFVCERHARCLHRVRLACLQTRKQKHCVHRAAVRRRACIETAVTAGAGGPTAERAQAVSVRVVHVSTARAGGLHGVCIHGGRVPGVPGGAPRRGARLPRRGLCQRAARPGAVGRLLDALLPLRAGLPGALGRAVRASPSAPAAAGSCLVSVVLGLGNSAPQLQGKQPAHAQCQPSARTHARLRVRRPGSVGALRSACAGAAVHLALRHIAAAGSRP